MPGKYFDDLLVGAVIRHALSRTVTEMDNVLFSALTMNTQPLHVDEQFAQGTPFGHRIVNGLFTLGLVTGMTVPDLTEGTIVANLGYDKVRHTRPVFHGDTLRVQTEVTSKRESKSHPNAGLVTLKHTATNQRGETVLEFERTALFLKRSEPIATGNAEEWHAYYGVHAKRQQPWPLLIEALARIERDGQTAGQAIDLGFGNGIETRELLRRGWHVLAVEAQAEAVQLLADTVGDEARPRLTIAHARFEEVTLPPADFVWAGLSLPFCQPQHFDALWRNIVGAIRTGGRFAGNFFGPRDEWASNPGLSFHSERALDALFANFDVEVFKEIERDAPAATAANKHWHTFSIVAKKN